MTAGRVVKNIPPKLVNFSAPLTRKRTLGHDPGSRGA